MNFFFWSMRVAYDEEMKMELGDYGVFVIVLRTCGAHGRG